MFDLRQFAAISPNHYLKLIYHDELDSTNTEARKLAESGVDHGTVVLADHQSSGRGRRGSSWVCNPGDGLLFSIILRPDFPQIDWSRIALATGLGIATSLNAKWSVGAQVKWPNDIYILSRKCAGILAEAKDDFVVVGVGINVFGSPDETTSAIPAIAVDDVMKGAVSREMVLAIVLDGVFAEVEACGKQFADQVSRLEKVCFLNGKRIGFTAGDQLLTGLVSGMGEDGSLMIDHGEGVRAYSQAAEIRVLH